MFTKILEFNNNKNKAAFISAGEAKLKALLPKDIKDIASLYKTHNKKIFVVGGAVRDCLLGITPKDFDLATDALLDESAEILKGKNITEQGKAFGVIVLRTDDCPEGYEIASFRFDTSKGRNPEVKLGATIEQDVNRRDLKYNALFYDIFEDKIIDLVGGVDDLMNGITSTVGNPDERFEEDALRLLRACVQSSKYGKLDQKTFDAIKRLKHSLLSKAVHHMGSDDGVSNERIVDEFFKGFKKGNRKFIDIIIETELIEVVFIDIKLKKPEIDNYTCIVNAVYDILLTYDKTVEARLKQTGWPNDLCKGLEFLNTIKSFDGTNVFTMYNKFTNSGLTANDVLNVFENKLDKKLLDTFLFKYKPTVDGNDLIANGFKGKDIFIEKNRLEDIIFKNLLSKN